MDEALELNIKRAHFVTVMWKSCITGILPELDPCNYGWEKDADSLRPTMLSIGKDGHQKRICKYVIASRLNVQLTDVAA